MGLLSLLSIILIMNMTLSHFLRAPLYFIQSADKMYHQGHFKQASLEFVIKLCGSNFSRTSLICDKNTVIFSGKRACHFRTMPICAEIMTCVLSSNIVFLAKNYGRTTVLLESLNILRTFTLFV